MRVATFNILHGRTVGDGVDPQRLRDCVRQLDPDVLALQEVDCDQPRSERTDLTAAAADAMGAVEHRFVAAIPGTPGATWVAATGGEQPGHCRLRNRAVVSFSGCQLAGVALAGRNRPLRQAAR